MRRLLLSCALGLLCFAVPASAVAAPIISKWSDVGTGVPVGSGIDKVAILDFTGGGIGDIFLSGQHRTPTILEDGYLGEESQFVALTQINGPVNGHTGSVGRAAAGDLNGDKVPDIVASVDGPTTGSSACSIRWLLSTGPRSPTRVRYTLRDTSDPTCQWGRSHDAALADADGDGDLDAYVATDRSVLIFHNDGTGNLGAPTILPSVGKYVDRITLVSLASPGKYPAGAFVPPTIFGSEPARLAQESPPAGGSLGTAAYFPAGGLNYAAPVTLAAPSASTSLPIALSPTQVFGTTGYPSARLAAAMTFNGTTLTAGTSFTFPASFPSNAFPDPSNTCSPTAVGNHLVNTTSPTFALADSYGARPSPTTPGAIHLFAQPAGETAIRDVRDINLPIDASGPTAGYGYTACAMAMGNLGVAEGGAPDDLVVVATSAARPSAVSDEQLFIFHSLTSTDGSARAAGPTGAPARLFSQKAKARKGSVTLTFFCPTKARAVCPLQSALLPSVGTASPYVVAAAIKPGKKQRFTVKLSPDAAAALKHGTISVRIRPVATGKPVQTVVVS